MLTLEQSIVLIGIYAALAWICWHEHRRMRRVERQDAQKGGE